MAATFEQKVKVFFEQADTGNGITIQSLAKVIRSACPNFKGSDQEIAQMFLEIDDDNDRLITWDEFSSALFAKNPKEVTRSQLEEEFKKVDTDGSGKLDKSEVARMVKALGIDWSDEDLEKAMADADPNGDGVSYDEFLAAWASE